MIKNMLMKQEADMEYMSWEEAGLIVGTEEWKEKQNNEKDPEKFCETVEKIAPTFGWYQLGLMHFPHIQYNPIA